MNGSTPSRVLGWVVVLAVGVLPAANASLAKAEDWLVVPVIVGDDEGDTPALADEVAHALALRGHTVRSNREAAKQFEAQVSVPPMELSPIELHAWAEHSRAGLGHLARNDYEGALRELEQAQAVSRKAVSVLNRDEETAAVLLDTCLYAVRALLGIGKQATAQVQAAECARLAPDRTPNAKMHPPSIRSFYEDVVEAGRSSAGSLAVESSRPGCSVRVNGRSFGRAPVRVESLTRGVYAVQAECDGTEGRIHQTEVERGTTTLRIDADLDASIRTDEALRLHYAAHPLSRSLQRDARSVGKLSTVDTVLLVAPSKDGQSQLIAVGVDQGDATSADVGASASAALAVLFGDKPVTTKPGRPPRGQFIAGVSLASIGTASLLTAYGLYAVNATKVGDDMVALPTNDNQARWLNLRTGMYYTGSAGAAALVAAMPLALPYRAKTPWWAWLSGGVGLGLAATSIALAVTAPATPAQSRVANPQGYVDRATRVDPAFLAGVTAVPLLTMPLVYLLRRDEKRGRVQVAPQVTAGRRAAFLGLEGRY